jgi:hypothetical protein
LFFDFTEDTQTIKLQPDSAYFFLSRGYAYMCKEMYDDAMTDYNQVIRLRLDSPVFSTDDPKSPDRFLNSTHE